MPSGYSICTSCSFDPTKNKLHCYKGEDFMESFCKDLREHGMKIMNYEKKEMIPLTYEEKELYEIAKSLLHMQKKYLVLIKMIKMYLNYMIKQEIIVITPEDLGELLIVSAI